jgi:ERF superfamily
VTETEDFGALAAALAKAQAAFPTIQRDKGVTVKTKAGGEYTFKYAPLDTILAAVRKPLSDNGLAIVQLLDDGDLVTMLLHSGGAKLSGSVALPTDVDIQGLGSAITYLRRYSLQAILGIAAEEDDDGNRASGNMARPVSGAPRILSDRRPPDPEPSRVDQSTGEIHDGPFTATVEGKVSFGKAPTDGQYRQTPAGFMYGFVVEAEGGKRLQVVATHLSEALQLAGAPVKGTWVTAEGLIERVAWKKDGKDMPPYQRMTLSRLTTPEYTLPAPKPLPPDEAAELDALDVPWPDTVGTTA